jgi:hypothetical protein
VVGDAEAIAALQSVIDSAGQTDASDPTVDTATANVPSVLGDLSAVRSGVDNIPISKTTTIATAGTGTAVSSLNSVRDALAAIKDKIVNVTTNYVSRAIGEAAPKGALGGLIAEGAILRGYAGGGIIPGTPPADPMVDNVLARGPGGLFALRSGEFVSTESATARNYAALLAGNKGATLAAVGYAGGGPVGSVSGGSGITPAALRQALDGATLTLTGVDYLSNATAARINTAIARSV